MDMIAQNKSLDEREREREKDRAKGYTEFVPRGDEEEVKDDIALRDCRYYPTANRRSPFVNRSTIYIRAFSRPFSSSEVFCLLTFVYELLPCRSRSTSLSALIPRFAVS